jgi:hypothetical protein
MKSTDRIIKDIRYYEIKPKDFTGDFNGIVVMFTKLLTVQIQLVNELRKLNKSEYRFDHIYITFTENIELGKIVGSEKFLDKRIKHVNYGIEPKAFNSLTEFKKNQISQKTFKSLTEKR